MRTVAIIGAGIGAEHLAGYATLPERFRVTTLCDLDETRAAAVAAPYDNIDTTTDFSAVLADAGVDIVDICLPPHLHLEACLAALDAGKIVVCEKPLVASLSEADKIAAKLAEKRGRLFPVFQYRYGTGTAQLRALIEAGLAGKCFAGTLETHWDRDAAYYANPWRGTWEGEQGGAILGHAIHIHDLLTSTLGPVSRVFADLATRVNDIETEDCAALTLRMKSGALITSSVTLGAAGNSSRMRLMFDGFTVESDHAPYAPAAKPWRFTARAPRLRDDIDTVLAKVSEVQSGFPGFFKSMADALDGDTNSATTFEDGRRSLEFVTAVYASARSGAPVELPLAKTHVLYQSWIP
ncbi:MAG: Gfo/Idh/MocA family oxidoreductase [Pseudomonadota bacterium]